MGEFLLALAFVLGPIIFVLSLLAAWWLIIELRYRRWRRSMWAKDKELRERLAAGEDIRCTYTARVNVREGGYLGAYACTRPYGHEGLHCSGYGTDEAYWLPG